HLLLDRISLIVCVHLLIVHPAILHSLGAQISKITTAHKPTANLMPKSSGPPSSRRVGRPGKSPSPNRSNARTNQAKRTALCAGRMAGVRTERSKQNVEATTAKLADENARSRGTGSLIRRGKTSKPDVSHASASKELVIPIEYKTAAGVGRVPAVSQL